MRGIFKQILRVNQRKSGIRKGALLGSEIVTATSGSVVFLHFKTLKYFNLNVFFFIVDSKRALL